MSATPDVVGSFTAAGYARRLDDPRDLLSCELVPVARLRAGDAVLCAAGDVVPAPALVLDGHATVRATVGPDVVLGARRPGRVGGGARLLWGWLVLRLEEAPG